ARRNVQKLPPRNRTHAGCHLNAAALTLCRVPSPSGSTASPRAVEAAADELKQLLGARASDAAAVRDHHSRGESYHRPAPPDIVCFPRSTDEVAAIVRVAARHRLPIVPFGAGTSLEGHVNAIHGGVTIDMRE